MMKIKQPNTISEQNSFQQILFKFIPFWHVFLILLLVSLSALFFYLKTTNAVYETSASVLIKDERKGQEESQVETALNATGTKNIVENELEILRSNVTIIDVVKKMHLYAPVFEEKGWNGLKTSSAYLTSPIKIQAENPDSFKTEKKIYFTYSEANKNIAIGANKYPLNEFVNTPWGKLRFFPNPDYTPINTEKEEAGKLFFSLNDVAKVAKSVGASLLATPTSRLSSIITLKFKDEIPQRGELIVQELVNAYNKNATARKNDLAIKTLNFIEARLKHVNSELDSIEGGIQQYRDRTGIVDITEQGRLYLESIEENDRQMSNINLQLSALEQAEEHVTSRSKEGNFVPSTYNINDPSLNQLLTKLYTAETDYERLKKTTAENNPVLTTIQEEINKTKPSIIENISNHKKNLLAGKALLNKTNNRYSSMLNTIPKKERQLVDVSRKQNTLNTTYAFLLQKREEVASSISSTLPDCTIVDQPNTSPNPVSPKTQLLGMLALIMPFVIGFAGITLKDIFRTKLLYRNEIEKLTTFPVIGEIINEKLETPIVTKNAERSFIVEQFRQIRNSLKYQGTPQGNYKRTLVTSSIKGEGKSFVSLNMAVSLARSGKKVALIEFDLYQPKLSEMLEVPNHEGISDYLSGKISDEDEIIIPTSIHPNLFLVPAGNQLDEPSEYLSNGKLELLLSYLDTRFDVLIIDTVPVKAMTDAYVIAAHCNLVLYIVRHNHTPKMLIEQLDEEMKANNINNVAIVFNGIKNRGWGKNGYGYGYGYYSKSSYDDYAKQKKSKRA